MKKIRVAAKVNNVHQPKLLPKVNHDEIIFKRPTVEKILIAREELEQLRAKAAKWDEIGQEVHSIFFDENGEASPIDERDLYDIGVKVTKAFGRK